MAVIATQAQAQIYSTDVMPDATYTDTNDTCSLDLDNDGNIDFLIVQRTANVPWLGNGPANCAATITKPRSRVRITQQETTVVASTASFASQLPGWQESAPASATYI